MQFIQNVPRHFLSNDWPVALLSADMPELFQDLVRKWILGGLSKSQIDLIQSHLVRLFSLHPPPLAAELRCVVGLLLSQQLHISTECLPRSYVNICLLLDGSQAVQSSHASPQRCTGEETAGYTVHTIKLNNSRYIRTPSHCVVCFFFFCP